MAICDALGPTREVVVPQGTIDYREAGDGPPVLLLHGGLTNGDLWRHVVPRLVDAGYRCITPDLPLGAHQRPMRPGADLTPPGMVHLVVGFLDALGIDTVSVVGNGAGGAIAQMLAADHPHRIDRLVLTACDNQRQFVPRYLKPVRVVCMSTPVAELLGHTLALRPLLRLFFASVAHTPLPPAILQSYLRPILSLPQIRRDLRTFFRAARPRHTVRAARALRGFTRPTLVVWAADDLWFSQRGGRRLAAAIPNARLEVLAGTRTFIPEDKPAELATLIIDFLDEPEPSHPALTQRRLLATPAGTIGYRETGSGAPIVFLHGIVSNGLAWRDVVPALADGCRCIAPDWPMGAHWPAMPEADLTLPGLARIVVDVLDALGIERAVLVGNGYGADIAQIVAAEHSERVDALVLVAPNAFDSCHWTVKTLIRLSRPPGAGTITALALRSRFVQRLPIAFGWVTKRAIPDTIVISYLTPLISDTAVRRDLRRFLGELSPTDLMRASAKLGQFDRPALVISPVEDRVFPHDGARRLARMLPQGHFTTIADSYAWVPEDQPVELAHLLRAFLQEEDYRIVSPLATPGQASRWANWPSSESFDSKRSS